jgi:hypothetical protein
MFFIGQLHLRANATPASPYEFLGECKSLQWLRVARKSDARPQDDLTLGCPGHLLRACVSEECGMPEGDDNPNSANPNEALTIARRIVTIPLGHLAESIRLMVRKRELSKAVRSLNALVLDHPQHRPIAKRALQHLGLW